jgi:hypothetical protein
MFGSSSDMRLTTKHRKHLSCQTVDRKQGISDFDSNENRRAESQQKRRISNINSTRKKEKAPRQLTLMFSSTHGLQNMCRHRSRMHALSRQLHTGHANRPFRTETCVVNCSAVKSEWPPPPLDRMCITVFVASDDSRCATASDSTSLRFSSWSFEDSVDNSSHRSFTVPTLVWRCDISALVRDNAPSASSLARFKRSHSFSSSSNLSSKS